MKNKYTENLNEINKPLLKEFLKVLNQEIPVFSDEIIKINKVKKEQVRTLIISNIALYNFKGKKLKRRIPIPSLYGITTSPKSDLMIIHGANNEYDYFYKYKNIRILIEILAKLYYSLTRQTLKLSLIKDKDSLFNYVTTKKEKFKNMTTNKFDDSNIIDIDIYLYGNNHLKNKKKNNKIIKIASIMKAQKTEIIFIREDSNDLINNLVNLKIENFRILDELLISFYGQILWVEFIFNKELYVMRVLNSNDSSSLIKDFCNLGKNINHPKFISDIECILKTNEKLFILNKFENFFEGGNLFALLKKLGKLEEDTVKIITAQIILIITYFHSKKINHMNFTPENFYLDKKGFINYFWDNINEKYIYDQKLNIYNKPREYTFINNDWFNLGVLIFELMFINNPLLYMKNNVIHFPIYLEASENAKNFIIKLLSIKDENEDFLISDIAKEPFLNDICFDKIEKRDFDPIIIPMNIDIEKQKNIGVISEQENINIEEEKYILYNYDSIDEDEEIILDKNK